MQDFQNPKPIMVGIAEDPPRQRVWTEELSTNEVEKSVRTITTLTSDDEFPGPPRWHLTERRKSSPR